MLSTSIQRFSQRVPRYNMGYILQKTIWIIIFLRLLPNVGASQTNYDSLYSIWSDQNSDAVERLNAVEEILNADYSSIYFENLDSALVLSQLQLQLAHDVQDTLYMVKGMMHIVDALIMSRQDPDQLDSLVVEGYKLAESSNSPEAKLVVLLSHAQVYYYNNDYVQSYKYFSDALKIAEAIGDKESQALCYREMAHKAHWAQNPERSVELFKKARELYKEMGNESDRYWASMGICRAYYFNEDYELAREVLEELKPWARQFPDSLYRLGTIYLQLSWNYSEEGNYSEAIENGIKALDIHEKINSRRITIKMIKAKLAEYYQLSGNHFQAHQIIDELKSLNYVSDGINYAHHSINIGNLYIDMGDFDEAIFHCKEAERVAHEKNNLINLRNSCECLYKAYSKAGMKSTAFDYLFRYNTYVDSFDIKNQARDLLFKELQREMLEDSLEVLNKNREVIMAHQAELHEKEKTRNWSLAGGLMALFLAGGFYSRWRYVTKAKAIIEEQKRQVEQSEKYKEQFLANMSHELRTPMHAISGMTKILERNKHPEFQEPYLRAIRQSSDNLVVILNDVLDMSKIEAGKLQIESVPMSPKAIVEHVISLLKYKADEKGIELTYEIGKDVPDMIMGDPTRLNQILMNLVGNGIKFTDQGQVHLRLTVEENTLQFEVRDTGIGIPEDKLPQIFRMFEQSDKSINRRFGGTGLGLSISQQLAELMGGEVTVQSELGRGSSFYMRLPYELASDQKGQELPSQSRLEEMAAALTGLKILIAEDNPFNQMIVKDDLTYYIKDVEIDIVENGKLAVEHYRRGEYDIILMDAQMPEMDGMEASKRIRTVEEEEGIEERIPIIAMTASLLRSEIDQYLGSGMDNYIPKPYQLEELIGTIYTESIEKNLKE